MPFYVSSVNTSASIGGVFEHEIVLNGYGNVDAHNLMEGDINEYLFPDKVVIKCQWCGQWAARKTACKHCGGPVE